jgi:hypothetical protein
MKPFFPLAFLFLLPVAIAWSDDPAAEAEVDPCVTDLTEEKLNSPPERKTKYEVVEEAQKMRLSNVKLVDQKFVAILRIQLPTERGNQPPTARYLTDEAGLRSLEYVETHSLGSTPFLGNGNTSAGRQSEPWLNRLVQHLPADRGPDKATRDFLASPESLRYIHLPGEVRDDHGEPPPFRGSKLRSETKKQRWISILATTPEEAEQRSRDLLSVMDYGFSRPIQVALFGERMKRCKEYEEFKRQLPLAQKSAENVGEKLKDYQEFTPDLLPGLRVQQLQLDVDLAGVKARIATCEKLMAAARGGKPERLQNIEDAKVAAEIELAGFEARRAKSGEFVTKVKERIELASQRDNAEKAIIRLKENVRLSMSHLKEIDAELVDFAPVQIVDDRVTIHPLEWTQ